MPALIDLLLCYGLCFGLMNKVDVLRKVNFFDRMLSCSYCTGFHAGWMGWVLSRVIYGLPVSPSMPLPEALAATFGPAAIWAFASAGFCYVVDVISQLAEGWVPREK
jgi:hypothetical protein